MPNNENRIRFQLECPAFEIEIYFLIPLKKRRDEHYNGGKEGLQIMLSFYFPPP
jgi:hypothetical protein